MGDAGDVRLLTGWQRAYVLAAARYVREQALKRPADAEALAVYAALLEVLEPGRRLLRQQREQRGREAVGSMWERRSGWERRGADRRTGEATPSAGGERRKVQRRSTGDRRGPRGG